MDIKKAVRLAMAANGIRQKELSKLSGISETTVSAMMTGKANPNSETIGKMAKGLGLSYSELIALGE